MIKVFQWDNVEFVVAKYILIFFSNTFELRDKNHKIIYGIEFYWTNNFVISKTESQEGIMMTPAYHVTHMKLSVSGIHETHQPEMYPPINPSTINLIHHKPINSLHGWFYFI